MNFIFYYLSLAVLLCSQALATGQNKCPPPPKGAMPPGVQYVGFDKLLGGQPSKSPIAVDLVANNSKGYPLGYYKDPNDPKKVVLCFDDGKSPFPFDKPFQVVALPDALFDNIPLDLQPRGKFVASDGHHTLIGTAKGIDNMTGTPKNFTVPVKINEELRKATSLKDFSQQAFQKNLIYVTPNSVLQLMNLRDIPDEDPNDDMRGFLQNTVLSCKKGKPINYENDNQNLLLWVDDGQNMNFIEFFLATALRNKGFHYPANTSITEAMVEEARHILLGTPSLIKLGKIIGKRTGTEKPIKIIRKEGKRLTVYDIKDQYKVYDPHEKKHKQMMLTPTDYCTRIVEALPRVNKK